MNKFMRMNMGRSWILLVVVFSAIILACCGRKQETIDKSQQQTTNTIVAVTEPVVDKPKETSNLYEEINPDVTRIKKEVDSFEGSIRTEDTHSPPADDCTVTEEEFADMLKKKDTYDALRFAFSYTYKREYPYDHEKVLEILQSLFDRELEEWQSNCVHGIIAHQFNLMDKHRQAIAYLESITGTNPVLTMPRLCELSVEKQIAYRGLLGDLHAAKDSMTSEEYQRQLEELYAELDKVNNVIVETFSGDKQRLALSHERIRKLDRERDGSNDQEFEQLKRHINSMSEKQKEMFKQDILQQINEKNWPENVSNRYMQVFN